MGGAGDDRGKLFVLKHGSIMPHRQADVKNRSIRTVHFPAAGVLRGRGGASAPPPAIGGGRGASPG